MLGRDNHPTFKVPFTMGKPKCENVGQILPLGQMEKGLGNNPLGKKARREKDCAPVPRKVEEVILKCIYVGQ